MRIQSIDELGYRLILYSSLWRRLCLPLEQRWQKFSAGSLANSQGTRECCLRSCLVHRNLDLDKTDIDRCRLILYILILVIKHNKKIEIIFVPRHPILMCTYMCVKFSLKPPLKIWAYNFNSLLLSSRYVQIMTCCYNW